MIAAFFALSATQRTVLIEAWCRFALWHVRIRWLPYRCWRRKLFSQTPVTPALPQADTAWVSSFISVVEKAGRHHLVSMNCLRRCLVTRDMLAARGCITQIHIGVRIQQGNAAAHMWLSMNGNVLNDSEENIAQYQELQYFSDTSLHAFV